jgi:hypothetical protein
MMWRYGEIDNDEWEAEKKNTIEMLCKIANVKTKEVMSSEELTLFIDFNEEMNGLARAYQVCFDLLKNKLAKVKFCIERKTFKSSYACYATAQVDYANNNSSDDIEE